MPTNSYDKDSIQSLDAREHIRLRSGMYVGDTSTPNQLLLEVFSNALDEHSIGHGNVIDIVIRPDGYCCVKDNGQGFIVGEKRDDGKTVLEASFSVINTSGKYSDDGVYQGSSLGLNGVGLKIATFLSKWLEVTTTRDGKMEHIRFENGVKVAHDICDDSNVSGTTVEWVPDIQFFETDKTQVEYFRKFFNDICCLCPNLTVLLDDGSGKIDEISKEGISNLIDNHLNNASELISNRFVWNGDSAAISLTFTDRSSCDIISYVNYGLTESGPHIVSMKTTLTRVLNSWARENGLLKEKEKNIDGASLQEGLVLVSNLKSKGVSYDAQTKGKVVKLDASPLDSFGIQLESWLDNNPEDAKAIIEKAIIARKASEAARKAREAVKNKKNKKSKVKILHPDKLKDAEFLGENSTLLIVEGLSAGASIAVARNSDNFGILMLRGKLINALSNKEEKLLKNEEIQLLFQALGIEPHKPYNPKDLRYGLIGICTDSDSDGFHISLLIMSALQHFCPQFIKEGRLCWLRSPLYILKCGKEEKYYFTDKELNEAKKKGLPKGELQRAKGLGSLSATQAKNSMFGENQYLERLNPTDESIELLYQLMGSNADFRKDFIFNNIDFSEVKE